MHTCLSIQKRGYDGSSLKLWIDGVNVATTNDTYSINWDATPYYGSYIGSRDGNVVRQSKKLKSWLARYCIVSLRFELRSTSISNT